MKIMSLLLLILATLSCTSSQSAQPNPLPVAQWRFIDADTRKPIEGVWVNFAWNGKPTERGLSTCVRGVLARSDKDGWVRDTAREPFWHLAPSPNVFKPGYQVLKYVMGEHGEANSTFITAKTYQDRNQYGYFPAWEEKLMALGYTWKDHYWTKRMPRNGIRDNIRELDQPEFYMVPYRSLPHEISFSFLGYQCTDDGAENIGLEFEKIKETDRARAITSTKYLCRKDWDSIKPSIPPWYQGGNFDLKDWITRAIWLMPDRDKAWAELQSELPVMYEKYTQVLPEQGAHRYNHDQRIKFCDWVEKNLE